MTTLLLALGGVVGALCRYHGGRLVQRRYWGRYPLSTFVVNISGCALLGLLMGFVGGHPGAPGRELTLLLGAGFCGAYTTFSSFALETSEVWRSGSRGEALFNLLAQPLLGLLAVWVGLRLGFLLP